MKSPKGEQSAQAAAPGVAAMSVARLRERLKSAPPHSIRPRRSNPHAVSTTERPAGGGSGRIERWQSQLSNIFNADFGLLFDEFRTLPRSVLSASLFVNVLGLALPLAMLQVYDRILPNQSTDTLLLLSIGLVGVFVLEAFLKIARSYVMGWSAVKTGFQDEITALTRHLKARRDAVDKAPPALWMDAFDAVGELNAFHGGQSRLIIVDLPMAAVFLVVAALVGGALVLVPITLIIGFGAFAALKSKDLQSVLSNRTDQDNKRYDFLVECLDGIHTIKGLAMEPQMQRRYERLQKTSSLASYDTIHMGNKLQTIGSVFANATMVSVVSVGAIMVMYGNLSIGALACCSLLSGRLTQPVLRGIGVWTELQNIELARERVKRFDELTVTDAKPEEIQLNGAISFDRVCFQEDGVRQLRLEETSLQIEPGEIIGIRGEEESGCTMLARLIIGDAAPTGGSVSIDGIKASGPRQAALRPHIAYVSGDAVSFNGTILENIAMFGVGEKLEAARRAARLIGLEDDIHRLPDGYDTQLAQGVTDIFSSGFMQRIAIARALAGQPKILILDEANTLLDMRSDALLRDGLRQLRRTLTCVLISNRPSLLALADRMFMLNDGRLVRQNVVLDNGAIQPGQSQPAVAGAVA